MPIRLGLNLDRIVDASLELIQQRGEQALHATRCLRFALHGFVSLEIEGGFAMPLDLDDSFKLLIRQQDTCLNAGDL